MLDGDLLGHSLINTLSRKFENYADTVAVITRGSLRASRESSPARQRRERHAGSMTDRAEIECSMIERPGFFEGTGMPDPGWWEALWPDPAGVLAKVGLKPG